MAEIINESLDLYGVKSRASALELVEQARKHANLTPDKAMQLAVKEVRAHRGGR